MHLTFVYVSAILNCLRDKVWDRPTLKFLLSFCFHRQILRITFKAPRVLVALKEFAIVRNTRQAKHGSTTTGQAKHVGIEPSLWKTFNLCTRLQYIILSRGLWIAVVAERWPSATQTQAPGEVLPSACILPQVCSLQCAFYTDRNNQFVAFESWIYGGPQLSHQNQMLTANSNHSRQIQIAHNKFKSLPFCRGSRVFFRVSRVHCRGSLFYTEKLWKSVKRINIKIAHRVLSIGVFVLIRVYCRHANPKEQSSFMCTQTYGRS